MINIDKIKYPHINHFYNAEPNIEAFLGRKLYVQEKLDGSNAGFYLNQKGEVEIRSRNNTIADGTMYKWAKQCGIIPSVKELLENASEWGSEYVLFGELYGTGKSPTRVQCYDKPFFVAFDLWSSKAGGFVPYVNAYQNCYHFDIPFVETALHGSFSTVAHLQANLEELLDVAREKHLEGYVIKTWDVKQRDMDNWGVTELPLMFKHKLDTPRLEKILSVKDFEKVILPVLPESEIYGAINRVKMDGLCKDFRDIKEAMPAIARYVGEECKKHNCRGPPNLHRFYLEVLKDG